MKVLNKYIVLIGKKEDGQQLLEIYDLLFLHKIASVKLPGYHIIEIFEDPKQENLAFFSSYGNFENKILIFDLKKFSFIGFLKHPFDLLMVYDDKMVFKNKNGNMSFIYKLHFEETKKFTLVNSEYLCKIDALHLYKNPFVLPCGNSACRECIYKKFNSYRKSFKCNFESCNEEHKVSHRFFEPDFKKVEMILSNFCEIFKCILNEGIFIQKARGKFF